MADAQENPTSGRPLFSKHAQAEGRTLGHCKWLTIKSKGHDPQKNWTAPPYFVVLKATASLCSFAPGKPIALTH